MSRLLVALVLALGLGVVTAVVVNANAGPHGNYNVDTNACAGCHRAHTAVGEKLLLEADEYALCTSCHDSSLGAITDVMNGRVGSLITDTDRLNGGGFLFVGGPSGVGQSVTSTHTVKGLGGGGGSGTAWGSYNSGSYTGPGVTGVLECSSCHNPHGSSNYRILRDETGAGKRWVANEANLRDWATNQPQATGDDDTAANKYSVGDNAYYVTSSMNNFCAACHGAYLSQSSSYDAGDGVKTRYRHEVGMSFGGTPSPALRLAYTGGNPGSPAAADYDGVACTTCHFAHGTAATMSGPAASATGGLGVDPTGDSALLYRNERGVCYACHPSP